MRDTWVLTVRTSLPKACENAYGLKLDVYAFESFQEGRDAVRKVMNKFAFAKNKMFDGKGKLTRMTWCSRYMVSEKEEECAPRLFLAGKDGVYSRAALQDLSRRGCCTSFEEW